MTSDFELSKCSKNDKKNFFGKISKIEGCYEAHQSIISQILIGAEIN